MTTSQTSRETNRDDYMDKLRAQMDQWKAELDKLEAKARESKADVKIEYQENVNKLKERWQTTRGQIEDLQNASGAAWKEMRAGTENAIESLKDAVHRARSRFE